MNIKLQNKFDLRVLGLTVGVLFVFTYSTISMAMPPGGMGIGKAHQEFLGGPWELIVRMKGMGGHALPFPITVADEQKPQVFDRVLDTKGAPIQLTLLQYIPDLGWDYSPQKQNGAGIVFRINVTGEKVDRTVWLSTSDPARTSIAFSGGGLKIKKIQDPNASEALIQHAMKTDVMGMLTVTPPNSIKAKDYPITASSKIILPAEELAVEVLQYVPHYSMDMKTRKVISRTNQPVNPAIRVKIKQGDKISEKWLWSRFPSFSHSRNPMDPAGRSPTLGLEFTHVDLSGPNPTWLLLADVSGQAWLLTPSPSQKVKAEKLSLGRAYPVGSQYRFKAEQMIPHAVLQRQWKNNSETLLHPAIVVRTESKNNKQDLVLELGKSLQSKIGAATMEYQFRRQTTGQMPANHPSLPMTPGTTGPKK